MNENIYVNSIKVITDNFWGIYWHSGLIQAMLETTEKVGEVTVTTEQLQANSVRALLENDTYTLEEYDSAKEFLEEFEDNYSSGAVTIKYIIYGD